ncbi:MAG: hydroxymethylbilane synthase [Sphingorhabdus sp.]
MTNSIFTADRPLRIGTRRSPLAMVQAQMTAAAIRTAHDLIESAVVLMPMLSSGDKIQDRPLAEIGGKALWTKELERAIIDNHIDIAVHSMKDVETVRDDSFTISAMLPRADIRDRLIGAKTIELLGAGARVGTSSPRRAAQLRRLRPDVQIVPLRGNVATRLARIDAGEADATLLAAAGLERLGMHDVGHAISEQHLLPAASQGAVGIDRLTARDDLGIFLDAINDRPTYVAVIAERAFLAALGGDCHSPVAALAMIQGDEMLLRGQIFSEDGNEMCSGEIRFALDDVDAPARLASWLLEQSSPGLRSLFER